MTAELILIGMGLGGIKGMTLEAIEASKNADHRFYESYTALWSEKNIKELEEEIGEVTTVMRPEIENPIEILELAKSSAVAILVVGDPLQATTHVDLQLQAMENGVTCRVIHGTSITGLVTGAVGLSNYKFGRQTTLTYPYNGWVATSPLEVIATNRIQNLHTLVLLDLDPTGEGVGKQIPMSPVNASNSLLLMSEKLKNSVDDFPRDTKYQLMKIDACKTICSEIGSLPVVLCSDMGTDDQVIAYTNVENLGNFAYGRLHCLIIPAELSDTEEKALYRWSKE